MPADLTNFIAGVPLIDHHCHSVVNGDLEPAAFEQLMTESDWPAPFGHSNFDSPFGVAIRAVCAPALDLEPHASAASYLRRRGSLSAADLARRLLGETGITRYIVETGATAPDFMSVDELAAVTGRPCDTIARLEVIAERSLAQAGSSAEVLDDVHEALDDAARGGLGFKSIVAYRYGLDFNPDRPSMQEVRLAVEEVLTERGVAGTDVRLKHPVLLRHLLWEAIDRAKPLQIHVGYGDSDINLHRCDPSQMTEFIRRTRTSGSVITLLHCYPFQREAAFLAQVYPHVYLDTGAAVNYTGFGSTHVVRESLELAPFHKVLFSTDTYGLPELYLCGAALWRRAVDMVFGAWVDEGVMSSSDAIRYVQWMASTNAEQVYGL